MTRCTLISDAMGSHLVHRKGLKIKCGMVQRQSRNRDQDGKDNEQKLGNPTAEFNQCFLSVNN